MLKAKTVNPSSIHLEDDALVVNASNAQLKSVSALADKLVSLQEGEAEAELNLKALKERRRAIEEVELVEAMDACGIKSLKLKNGAEIVIDAVVSGSITKANEEPAFEWLRGNGHAGIIKTNVTVALSKGQDKEREAVLKKLRTIRGIEVQEKSSVHPQTLGAWARELVKDGKDFPKELLGIWLGRKAKVIQPKP